MSKASPVIRILFVCTGNICRSPTAEGVFRHFAEKEGLGALFRIDSAGTEAYHAGDPPDHRAIRIAKKYGVDIAGQRARTLAPEDYDSYDYIYAMDNGHFSEIKGRAPKTARAKIGMFLDAAEVPDPWYGGDKDFEEVYALVSAGAAAILEKIRKDHGI
jgi:protein-tyrosine phosphatase